MAATRMPDHLDEDQKYAILNSFMQYVQASGLKINPSIRPYHFPGHGLGICATGPIEAKKTLIHVPTHALLTVSSIPPSFCPEPTRKELSVHGLLAAFIAFDEAFTNDGGRYSAWKATWPSFEDFRASLPLLWPKGCRAKWDLSKSGGRVINEERGSSTLKEDSAEKYRDEVVRIIPSSITDLVEAQAARYQLDFDAVLSVISSAQAAFQRCHQSAKDSFTYAWYIVNTRCLYFDPSKSSHHRQQDKAVLESHTTSELSRAKARHDSNQHMVLCRLIDLFNHSSNATSACIVTHDTFGFTVTSQNASSSRDGDEEEIFVSYGPHNNDFLLVEYGFILPDNDNLHDSISLDSIMLPSLSEEQKRQLDARGYLGKYTLFSPACNDGKAGVCWRTEIVARLGILSEQDWDGLMDGSVDEDDIDKESQDKANVKISAWIRQVEKEAERSTKALAKLADDQEKLVRFFGDDTLAVEEKRRTTPPLQSESSTDISLMESESHMRIAKRRHNLVLDRWNQILHICQTFLSQNGR